MARTDRLFRLLHLLRILPQPVTAARLAEETGVSERTLYRDIETLRASGALIDGEAGFGYRLTEDPALPPLMFDRHEIEALVLGLSEVQVSADPALAKAAQAALTKITARLPDRVSQQAAHAVSYVYRYSSGRRQAPEVLDVIRRAAWDERALHIDYCDAAERRTERVIWPLTVAFLGGREMVLAWCCLRNDFRKFNPERMVAVTPMDDYFRPQRVPLLRAYLALLRKSGSQGG